MNKIEKRIATKVTRFRVAAAGAVVAFLYAAAFWVQNVRAENYCLRARVLNSAEKAWTYTGYHVSPWTLRAFCTWPGLGSITPAMVGYAGRAAVPDVANMSTLKDIERLEDELLRKEASKKE